MFLWINLHDQDLISAWYGKHGLCLLLCLFYHDTVSLCEVFRREVFPSYTSWVASKKSASLSKPKMTQVVKWMPVLKKKEIISLCSCQKIYLKKERYFFSPLLMSEKDAPHSTPGSLDPLLCSTPEMSAWIWFRQMFKKNCFNTTGSECNIGCHELPRLFEELLMFLSALPQMCPCWVTKAWRHFNIWAWLAWWRICVFM